MSLTLNFGIQGRFQVNNTFVDFKEARNPSRYPYWENFYQEGGYPGYPFEEGELPSPSFSQGTTINFDAYLYYKNKPLDPEQYEVQVILKTSNTANGVVWESSTLEDLHRDADTPNRVSITIPQSLTQTLMAGQYFYDIVAFENKPYGQRHVLYNDILSIEYTQSSPQPENATSTKIIRVPQYQQGDRPIPAKTF